MRIARGAGKVGPVPIRVCVLREDNVGVEDECVCNLSFFPVRALAVIGFSLMDGVSDLHVWPDDFFFVRAHRQVAEFKTRLPILVYNLRVLFVNSTRVRNYEVFEILEIAWLVWIGIVILFQIMRHL